ncbi:MAG: hypothetical protein EOO01_25395 [Chitinophagaceae bacterium]|nr:MAG: hypothetical protein EOO01_25395 [Chitinophagaceae bacterium]
MKKKYYVNRDAQSKGDHEVHVEGCQYEPSNRTYLGEFYNCQDAVREAKSYFSQTNGCKTCCNPCHTS